MNFHKRDLRIGIDFDNTIVNYDDLFYQVALKKGLINSGIEISKDAVRSQVRNLDNGEIEWQKLQTYVYTRCMHKATLMKGVAPFIKECKDKEIKIVIISHKTQFAKHDLSGIDLRTTALDWMHNNGFFDKSGMNCQNEDIFFESSRIEKITRIKLLRCTHFIDDLEEIFLEKEFPKDVEKLLFIPSGKYRVIEGVKAFTDWKQIYDNFFSDK
jgi:hypothetical protein